MIRVIIVNLKGGLGNQMFQYALGYCLSKKAFRRLFGRKSATVAPLTFGAGGGGADSLGSPVARARASALTFRHKDSTQSRH